MSETTTIALIGAASTTGVALLGLASNVWLTVSERSNRRKEKDADFRARESERQIEEVEWYRRSLFDRRIEAIHNASVWMIRLQKSRTVVVQTKTKESRDSDFALCEDARQWYWGNTIYLYGKVPDESPFSSFLLWVGLEDDEKAYWDSVRDSNKELNRLTREILETANRDMEPEASPS